MSLDAAVVSRTAPKVNGSRPYTVAENIDVSRRSNTIVLTVDGIERHVALDKWVQAIASTSDAGQSPELRSLLEYILGARQAWIEDFARRTEASRNTYGNPQG